MPLADLMTLSLDKSTKKYGLSEERIQKQIPALTDAFSFYREYPDIFVYVLCGESNPEKFELFFYQRVFLRAAMRHRYTYATFPRA